MKIHSFVSTASLIAASLLLLTGCGSTPKYVNASGPETVVSLDRINVQDWANAADDMVRSLLVSPTFENSVGDPAVLAISRIVNNTQQQVDTDYLIRRIRVALNQSGKTVTTTTIGLGAAEDPLAKEAGQMAEFLGEGKQLMPKYTLSGKLLEDRVRAGRTRQVTYTFQLALTEVSTGLAVWEDVKEIAKQGTKPSVGW